MMRWRKGGFDRARTPKANFLLVSVSGLTGLAANEGSTNRKGSASLFFFRSKKETRNLWFSGLCPRRDDSTPRLIASARAGTLVLAARSLAVPLRRLHCGGYAMLLSCDCDSCHSSNSSSSVGLTVFFSNCSSPSPKQRRKVFYLLYIDWRASKKTQEQFVLSDGQPFFPGREPARLIFQRKACRVSLSQSHTRRPTAQYSAQSILRKSPTQQKHCWRYLEYMDPKQPVLTLKPIYPPLATRTRRISPSGSSPPAVLLP